MASTLAQPRGRRAGGSPSRGRRRLSAFAPRAPRRVLQLIVGQRRRSVGAFAAWLDAAFGSPVRAQHHASNKTLPRLLAALGIALALRAGLWNIGAEGQLYIGAARRGRRGPATARSSACRAARASSSRSSAASLAGAAWGVIPGVLRAQRGISEVITSLMLVYVAIQLANYLVEGPWLVPGGTFPRHRHRASGRRRLPIIWPGTLAERRVVIAVAAAVARRVADRVSRTTLRPAAPRGRRQRARRRLAACRVRWLIVAGARGVSGAFAGAGRRRSRCSAPAAG